MKRAIVNIKGTGLGELSNILKKVFKPSFCYSSHNKSVFFCVFEKLSYIQGSDMSGTILADFKSDHECIVNVIVSGGRRGLIRMDLFEREWSFLGKIEKSFIDICAERGWVLNSLKDKS